MLKLYSGRREGVLKYGELKKSLSQRIEPIYILCGCDDFLRAHSVNMISALCVSVPELNFLSADGDNFTAETAESVYTALQSYPFMSERRMVVLKEYYPSKEELKRNGLLAYLSAPVETSVLIISNRKECKAFDKTGVKVDCTPDTALCISWIAGEAKRANLAISPSVAGKIAEYTLLDFTKINGEMAKLTVFCEGKGAIELSDVEEVVHKDSEYRIFEMTEKIALGKFDEAYGILTDLLAKGEEEQRLFISVYYHFRRMLHVAVSTGSDAELAEALGIKEFAVSMTRRQMRKFPVKRIKYICDRFAMYDAAFKRGDTDLSSALWNGVFTAMISE